VRAYVVCGGASKNVNKCANKGCPRKREEKREPPDNKPERERENKREGQGGDNLQESTDTSCSQASTTRHTVVARRWVVSRSLEERIISAHSLADLLSFYSRALQR
jgi:hypothetical protein